MKFNSTLHVVCVSLYFGIVCRIQIISLHDVCVDVECSSSKSKTLSATVYNPTGSNISCLWQIADCLLLRQIFHFLVNIRRVAANVECFKC